MARKTLGIVLPAAADIFSTQEERDQRELGSAAATEVAIDRMVPFPDHPYSVRDDDAMVELISSISQVGILNPLLLRPIEGDRYMVVSGHRRKRAAEVLGMDTLPAIVRDMTDDEAIIAMADANLQRPEILPSEKARAYKMKLEAMKRKAGRPAENGAPEEHLLRGVKSIDALAEQTGESREQIRRYVRVAGLIPDLLELMDEGRMKMRPAVELSYLSGREQELVFDAMSAEACTPSHDQAKRIRKMAETGELDEDAVVRLMRESKPNQEEALKIRMSLLSDLMPKGLAKKDAIARVLKALELLNQLERAKAAKTA